MPQTDAEHYRSPVNLAAWITLVAMIMCVSGKVATKWRMTRKLENDDILMILAMVSTKPLGQMSSYAQHVF